MFRGRAIYWQQIAAKTHQKSMRWEKCGQIDGITHRGGLKGWSAAAQVSRERGKWHFNLHQAWCGGGTGSCVSSVGKICFEKWPWEEGGWESMERWRSGHHKHWEWIECVCLMRSCSWYLNIYLHIRNSVKLSSARLISLRSNRFRLPKEICEINRKLPVFWLR